MSKKSTAGPERPIDKPALELTARERTAFEKYRERHATAATAATRMKLVNDADKSRLVPNRSDEFMASCC
jgi:hypothetical protein